MKKLMLDVERLEVTSFDTMAPAGERGTVEGHDISGFSCPPTACYSIPTRHGTCCTPLV